MNKIKHNQYHSLRAIIQIPRLILAKEYILFLFPPLKGAKGDVFSFCPPLKSAMGDVSSIPLLRRGRGGLFSFCPPLKGAKGAVSSSSDVAYFVSVLKMPEFGRIHPVGLRPPPLKRGILSLHLRKASSPFRRVSNSLGSPLCPSECFLFQFPSLRGVVRSTTGWILLLSLHLRKSSSPCRRLKLAFQSIILNLRLLALFVHCLAIYIRLRMSCIHSLGTASHISSCIFLTPNFKPERRCL